MSPSKKNPFRRLYDKILDFILPRKCILCGKINPKGEFENICPKCARSIKLLNGARCLICAEPVGDANQPDIVGCPNCMRFPPDFNRCFAVAAFDGAVREMIIELKYRTGTYIMRDMSILVKKSRGIREFLQDAILVPVPLHRSRIIRRKYNQSDLIARMLAKTFPECNIKVKPMLKRIRKTKTQTTLDRDERAENMRGAFAIADKSAISKIPKDGKIIVVDDVITTSVTLSECAKIIKGAGYKNVNAFAIAHRI